MEGLPVHSFVEPGSALGEEPLTGCPNLASFGANAALGLRLVWPMPEHLVLGGCRPSQEHLFPARDRLRGAAGPWGLDELFPFLFKTGLSYFS